MSAPPHSCAQAWHALDLSACKPLGFDLVGWIAILGALASIAFFIARRFRRKDSNSTDIGPFKRRPWRSRFAALCRATRPLMDENGRIFREFGPNSGAGGPARVVRQNVGVWKQMMPTIVENNARIRAIIKTNWDAIPQRYAELFGRWLNHIDAFEAHTEDPLADYRHHQFPAEVVNVVNGNA